MILGRRHLEGVLKEFIDHYNEARPDQGLGQRRPCESADVTPTNEWSAAIALAVSSTSSIELHNELTQGMIAVGTDVAAGPPHRSQRALLTHWAPASGIGVEPSIREGVQHTGRWQPLGPKTAHAAPVQTRALAAAP